MQLFKPYNEQDDIYLQTRKPKVDFHKIPENLKILFLNISIKPSNILI